MNLLGKGTISAALFAATASVICAAPAQALSLTGSMSFAGSAEITQVDPDDYSFDFLDNDPNAFTLACEGSFNCIDAITVSDFDIEDGALAAPGFVFPFITGISTSVGDVSFVLTSVGNLLDNSAADSITFTLHGLFYQGRNTVVGNGSFSGEYDTVSRTYSATLEPVPTPAAVLPVLGGLLGMASKRKRNEEENA